MNVTEGENVHLECVTGFSAPPAVLNWERDGVLVTERADEAYYGSPADGTVLIKNMNRQPEFRMKIVANDNRMLRNSSA